MRLAPHIVAGLVGCLVAACASSTPQTVDDSQAVPPPAPQLRTLARLLATPTIAPDRLPAGTRQLAEGYWLGAMIDPSDAATLQAMGVTVVVSAVDPGPETRDALSAAGIAHVRTPMGATFRHAEQILEIARSTPPERIFIHCRHGADRTGAIAAFLLTVRHDWDVADALYAVLYPSQSDIDGLAGVLTRHGLGGARPADDPSVGFYSLRAAGEVGGLKARNARYAALVETTIAAIFEARPMLVADN